MIGRALTVAGCRKPSHRLTSMSRPCGLSSGTPARSACHPLFIPSQIYAEPRCLEGQILDLEIVMERVSVALAEVKFLLMHLKQRALTCDFMVASGMITLLAGIVMLLVGVAGHQVI